MRRRAIFIFVVLLVMLTATRPSAAVGPCNTDNHDLTVINLKTDTGYIIRLNLWRDSEGKIHGLAFWNARDAEHGGGRGTVNGEFLPNGGISIRINLQYPAPPGAQILISGRLFEGYGKGTLWETDWDSDAPTTHWTAQTLDGCPKWPDGPYPPKKPTPLVARYDDKLNADGCEIEAKTSVFPVPASHLGMMHPCSLQMNTGPRAIDSLKENLREPVLTTNTKSWAASYYGFVGDAPQPLAAEAFPCVPRPVQGPRPPVGPIGPELGQPISLGTSIGFRDCPPRVTRDTGTLQARLAPPASSPKLESPKLVAPRPKPGPTVATPTAPRSSSGFDGSYTPRGSDAINRLTGDGMGGAVSSSPRLPDGNRPTTGARSSGGATTAAPVNRPASSSGFDRVQGPGTNVPRPMIGNFQPSGVLKPATGGSGAAKAIQDLNRPQYSSPGVK